MASVWTPQTLIQAVKYTTQVVEKKKPRYTYNITEAWSTYLHNPHVWLQNLCVQVLNDKTGHMSETFVSVIAMEDAIEAGNENVKGNLSY